MKQEGVMEIGSKYIRVESTEPINNEPAYVVVNKNSGAEIACICYYARWRKYTMVTDGPAVFDVKCLESIIKFIQSLQQAVLL